MIILEKTNWAKLADMCIVLSKQRLKQSLKRSSLLREKRPVKKHERISTSERHR